MENHSYYAAILTLYNKDFKIDREKMGEYIQFLISRDVKGFFPCGTSGEYISHTPEENIELLKLVLDENKGRKPVIPCASTSSFYNTVQLIQEMEKLGIEEVSVCPPYYTPFRQEDVYDYYKQLLKEVKVSLYLYNIPGFTNAIEFDTFLKLYQEPRIIGIKDSSGSMKTISRYISCKERERKEFRVMTGTDEMILPALAGGCYGSVSALSGIIPEAHNAIYESFHTFPEFAEKLQSAVTGLAIKCESILFPVGYKLALAARGFDVEPFRQNVAEQKKQEAFQTLKESIKMDVEHILHLLYHRQCP